LIGNKCDWDEKRAVTLEQGRQLADELGLRFVETSAKDNEGVEEAFFTLARFVETLLKIRWNPLTLSHIIGTSRQD
jgi:Ras-related protein Rab-8A